MKIEVVSVDYLDKQHSRDLSLLVDSYARDPMGGGTPLDADVKSNLAAALAKLPHAFSFICYVDDQPAGLVNCFEAFSTFQCKPLVNIHDVIVLKEFRGLGISQRLLKAVEQTALSKGACKMTLEVLEGNLVAREAYVKFGFEGYQLDAEVGKALFWQKTLC